ncbi:MAG: hypothetical protein AAGC54_08350, partial [Cyanobacteria bacterium P01_F01_bin.4]
LRQIELDIFVAQGITFEPIQVYAVQPRTFLDKPAQRQRFWPEEETASLPPTSAPSTTTLNAPNLENYLALVEQLSEAEVQSLTPRSAPPRPSHATPLETYLALVEELSDAEVQAQLRSFAPSANVSPD